MKMVSKQRIHTYDRLGEINLLHAFLEAKLLFAIDEWYTLSTMNLSDDLGVIKNRLTYARHQVSVIKQLLRDSANPERTIKRWLDKLESRGQGITSKVSVESAKISGEQSLNSPTTPTA